MEAAVEAFRRAFADTDARQRKSASGKMLVTERYGVGAVGTEVQKRIDEISSFLGHKTVKAAAHSWNEVCNCWNAMQCYIQNPSALTAFSASVYSLLAREWVSNIRFDKSLVEGGYVF